MGETRPPNLLNTQIYSKQAHSKKSRNVGVKNMAIIWPLAMKLDIFILIRLIQTMILEYHISSRKRKVRKTKFILRLLGLLNKVSIFVACVLQALDLRAVLYPVKSLPIAYTP